jgi:hypothetical protein
MLRMTIGTDAEMARFRELPNHVRPFQRAPQLLRRRHFALQVEEHLPRFRRCVGGAHSISSSS